MPAVPFPGEYFKMIQIHAVARADAALRPLGLTAAQSDVLRFLSMHAAEETTVQDIGAFFHLKHPTVIGILRRLEEKGFISAAQSPRDRRCRIIRPTAKADEVMRVMEQVHEELDARSALGFTDAELLQLRGMLERVYKNVSGG